MDTFTIPFELTTETLNGELRHSGLCPYCEAEVSAPDAEQARQLADAHRCDPDDVRGMAVVWTVKPDGQITIIWAGTVWQDPSRHTWCPVCRRHGAPADQCPGAVAHAQVLLDEQRATADQGVEVRAAVHILPAYMSEDFAAAEIQRRLSGPQADVPARRPSSEFCWLALR